MASVTCGAVNQGEKNIKEEMIIMELTRRNLFTLGAAATTCAVAAAGVALAGEEDSGSERAAGQTSEAALGAAANVSVTFEESVSENVLEVENTQAVINEMQGVVYKQGATPFGVTTLIIDILSPFAMPGNALPLVVFINGGGFTGSDPSNNITTRMALAKAGYVVTSLQNRVVPNATFPAPLEDLKAAVRWLRAHVGAYGVDPARVAAVSNSSGGYFATMLGVTGDVDEFDTGDNLDQSSAVSAVIDLYGVSDLTIIATGLGEEIEGAHYSAAASEAMLINGTADGTSKGASVFETPEVAAKASPFTYIAENAPAFLILHGDQDTLVSPVASMELYRRLVDAGVEAERYVVAGAEHGDALFDQPEIHRLLIDFLDKHLAR